MIYLFSILTRSEDSFIREGYFGGATDYYKMYGENLYHYDVNSLYPYAMLNIMPFEIEKYYSNLNNINIDNLFGFFEVEITCPDNIKYPIIPYRDKFNSKGVIYPKGQWKGVYFSELLKKGIENGYKIKLIKGYSFSKKYLFNEYVNHFYNIKKNSFGAQKYIAKIHLNQLYGYFGRSLDLIHTENLNIIELKEYLALLYLGFSL